MYKDSGVKTVPHYSSTFTTKHCITPSSIYSRHGSDWRLLLSCTNNRQISFFHCAYVYVWMYTYTSGYATMVHGRGCNPHRSTTTFTNVEITSLWRHNSETIRERRPPRAMKSSELSNGENRIALRQLLQNRKLPHLWRHNLGSRWKLQKKWLERILVLVRSTI